MASPAKDPSFADLFGNQPEARTEAPGRVNLIGEHTDYHQGFVLPTAVPQHTRVELRRRADSTVRAWSRYFPEVIEIFEIGREQRRSSWIDYIQGMTAVLTADGQALRGFDVRIESTVPLGSGLSSSAALEISVLRALRQAFTLPLDDVAIAQIGQRAETDFVGAPVGIMDQMASSLARAGEALFLDTRSLARTCIPLPPSLGLIVIDSGVPHRHAAGSYAARRRESFEAAALLGVTHLRDVSLAGLPAINALPPLLARRARHIVTENARVLTAVDALRQGDIIALGHLFNASHESMRGDYEISTPDVDALVAIGQSDRDVHGARLTGGGFGGSVVMAARAGAELAAGDRILREYHRNTGRRGARVS